MKQKKQKSISVSVIQLLLGSEPRLTSEGSDSVAKKASYWQSNLKLKLNENKQIRYSNIKQSKGKQYIWPIKNVYKMKKKRRENLYGMLMWPGCCLSHPGRCTASA